MSIKPMLFNTDMVRAILDGKKTVTRRVVKPQPDIRTLPGETGCYVYNGIPCGLDGMTNFAPYRKDDLLWVRETFSDSIDFAKGTQKYEYKADHKDSDGWGWRPSIHMPKEAARIFLRVTDVRVERLQDCGNAQAKDEGCTCCSQFSKLWDSTVKPTDREKYGWAANPWVWVISFERCDRPEGWPG